MSKKPRIVLLHGTPVAMEPIQRAFATRWPEAEIVNLLDDSLAPAVRHAGSVTPAMDFYFDKETSLLHRLDWRGDFYRFSDPREWEDAGFREVFARPGLKLAEWPEKAAGALPTPDLTLHLALHDDPANAAPAREVRVQALTPVGKRLLDSLVQAR